MASSLQVGMHQAWMNVRLAVDSVIKGSVSIAKRVDYDALPAYLTPPLAFRLDSSHIVVQDWNQWRGCDLEIGKRGIYAFRRCHHCVTLPGRTDRTSTASPLLCTSYQEVSR